MFAWSVTLVVSMDYLRKMKQESAWQHAEQSFISAGVSSPVHLSARAAAWLFVRDPRTLSLRQMWQLEPLRTHDEDLGRGYGTDVSTLSRGIQE